MESALSRVWVVVVGTVCVVVRCAVTVGAVCGVDVRSRHDVVGWNGASMCGDVDVRG